MGDTRLSFSPIGSHVQYAAASVSTQVATTIAKPGKGETAVLMQVQTQNLRFTLDGTAATSVFGFQLKAGDPATQVPVASATVIKVAAETNGAILETQFGN